MSYCRFSDRWASALFASVVALVASGAWAEAEVSRPGVLRGVAYDPESSAGADPARTLDLFLPEQAAAAPPLVAFVHSQFWTRNDGGRDLEAHFARALQAEGAAVAVIRHRLSPAHEHPVHAEDVAAALAFLAKGAPRYAYDPGRIYLAGHSSGGHLAALLALDPSYLEAHGMRPDQIAGVIGISGIYDLDPDRELAEEERDLYRQAFGRRGRRRAASPARMPRADAPPFLVLTAAQDIPGLHRDGMEFTEKLRAAGHQNAETFMIVGRDHLSVLWVDDLRNAARGHLLSFIGLGPLSDVLSDLYAARKYWRKPTTSTLPFWKGKPRPRSHDVDERFTRQLGLPFAAAGRASPLEAAESYHAIDLFEYLEARDPEALARASHLILTNARGEQRVWALEAIRPYEPVIVVGVDDEKDLFRILDVYHTEREYSWTDETPEQRIMARPLGGFIHFLQPPPAELERQQAGRFALTPESFRLSGADPLGPIRDLPDPLRSVLVREESCLSCHSFRAVGGKGGHLRARDGALVGGFGLPLESYAPEVWRRYLEEPDALMRAIGAPHVVVEGEAAEALGDLIPNEGVPGQP